jgi:hypothetical protein
MAENEDKQPGEPAGEEAGRRVPVERWIPEDPHDFSDWMGTFGPLPKASHLRDGDEADEAERNEQPKNGRYVPASEMGGGSEVFPLGPKAIEAAIRRKRRLKAESPETQDLGDTFDG